MHPFRSSFGIIAAINGKMAGASVLAMCAWYLWPETARNWQSGVMSIIFAVMSFCLLIGTAKTAVKLHIRDRAIAAYLAQGPRTKTAEMTAARALKKAGMLDD